VTQASRPAGISLGLYAAAFLLLLTAGACIGAAVLDELQETRLLWVSAGLSYAAVVLALLSLLLPSRSSR
jgi:predicted MFS family arabinose efflux permease